MKKGSAVHVKHVSMFTNNTHNHVAGSNRNRENITEMHETRRVLPPTVCCFCRGQRSFSGVPQRSALVRKRTVLSVHKQMSCHTYISINSHIVVEALELIEAHCQWTLHMSTHETKRTEEGRFRYWKHFRGYMYVQSK